MRKKLILLTAIFLMVTMVPKFAPPVMGQEIASTVVDSLRKDSSGVKDAVKNIAQNVTLTPLPASWSMKDILKVLPDWIGLLAGFLLMFVLPAVQFVLKRIPSDKSVKIQGVLGKLADFLTFFQPDKNTNGGNHT